ncbi:hypothetical protein OE88DRAFT_398971 [Heliocybe sulcata]|uniref:RING-type domain-containing protein n=1 Tax=Heliocybe sulcata TaxID=5364 RepID=A0A5C3MWH4_9AGAM|nr:hypothetical protein OE88DRAFT_398971 [Heliocybe sulcata]
MDIIEISSSPEHQPNPRANRRIGARRRTVALKVTGDVIEISDSDGETRSAVCRKILSKQTNRDATPPKAGPSRQPASHARKAGSSQDASKLGGRASQIVSEDFVLPLFLPEDDGLDISDAIPKFDERHPSPPRSPSPIPEKVDDVNLAQASLAQVLEIVPDVEPEHAIDLIERVREIKENKGEEANVGNVVEAVLHNLFESANYPKLDRKGKGRNTGGIGKRGRDEEFEGEAGPLAKKVKLDFDSAFFEDDGLSDQLDCACCFSPYAFNKLIQCPDAHLFCPDCMTSYVGNLLGMGDPNIKCMDQSGCKENFTDGELRRFMDPKLLELYDKVRMRKDIEAAQLEGLEECPYCEYKVVIDNAEEKLFRCENKDCGAVTCRECKKDDHLPRTCQEVEDDKKIDARHIVEEAMTQALMRNCPKCSRAFVKEDGCNKMTCPQCSSLHESRQMSSLGRGRTET